MKTLLIITGISLIGIIYLFILGSRDCRYKELENGTVITQPEDDADEFPPKNMISDQTIARVVLRNKLKEIEKERDI